MKLNTRFFELFRKSNVTSYNLESICENFDLRSNYEPLPLQDRDAKKYNGQCKLFKVGDIKIRFFPDSESAERVFECSLSAYKKGIPISEPLKLKNNSILFRYQEGKTCTSLTGVDFEIIGKIHSDLNSITEIVDYEDTLRIMLNKGADYLFNTEYINYKTALRIQDMEIPRLQTVLDHDDFGIHNIIMTDKGFGLVDEESIGVLPFGFCLIRPLYDKNYGICKDNKQRLVYISQFNQHQRSLFEANERFFIFSYLFRNSIRKLEHNNQDGGIKMLERLKTLI